MGKVATTTEMKRKKKKGRPPKASLLSTPTKPINYDTTATTPSRRSTRRNPNLNDFDEFDDDEDERKEKKVKLVVRLPESHEKDGNRSQGRHSRDDDSGSAGSESDPDSEDREDYAKKRKINAVDHGSNHEDSVQENEVVKETETLRVSDSDPTIPLPDKTLLVFILDRLQKKDTRGVFSEAVDPDELPDYYEIIEQPMDFGTVRKKLDDGAYKSLDELEADVFLICSNAMQYNAPDTIYYRQARSIQELAKRDFENLKHEGVDGEPQPKVVRRGRPPSNNQKKVLETSPVEHVGPRISSGATLASEEDNNKVSNSTYNLRKAPAVNRFRYTDTFMSSYRPRNGENYSEWSGDWNNEFPAKILRADMKYGKKHFTVDEGRRETYGQFHPLAPGNEVSVFSVAFGDMKRLVPVGLQEPLAYARSLARYAANLGPVAWKIASKKIDVVLPAGIQYGPGWVGENAQKSPNSTPGDCISTKHLTPSTSDSTSAIPYGHSQGIIEAVKKLNSQNEQNPVYQSPRNGFNGMFSVPTHSKTDGFSDPSSNHSRVMTRFNQGEAKLPESWNTSPPEYEGSGKASDFERSLLLQQQRHLPLSVAPDLNVRVPAGSPTSSLQIGSPQQQPDLALQL